MTKREYVLKVVLIGDGAVGKTSIRNRFMGYGFETSHLMTLGADFSLKEVNRGDEIWKFQIWDLAGQEMFQQVRARFYQGAMGALLVFDITRKQTFLNITNWLNELYRYNGRGVVPVIVLANKADLRDKKSIKMKDVEKYVEKLNARTKQFNITNYALETSAKTGLNVDKAFELLGTIIRNRQK